MDSERGIRIGTRHTMLHDGLCWVVIEHPARGSRTREDKRGNVTLVGSRKYFHNVEHALREIYNSKLKGVESIEDLQRKTSLYFKEIKAVGKEIREAVEAGIKNVLDNDE